MEISLIYLLLVNAAAFLLMLSDKHRARKNLWRIPERVLLSAAVLGGSLGAIAGMKLFRHKTRHAKFYIGLPLILAIQILLGIILCVK